MNTKAHSRGAQDAVDLLMADHREVKEKFAQYEQLGPRAHVGKQKLAEEICLALTKHTVAEEEIFYPAVRAAVRDSDDMMDEALVEHAGAKDLIAQLLAMDPDDELYDAKVKVLSEQIDHHVEEEESEMFPKARKSSLDLAELARQIAARKDEVDLSDAAPQGTQAQRPARGGGATA